MTPRIPRRRALRAAALAALCTGALAAARALPAPPPPALAPAAAPEAPAAGDTFPVAVLAPVDERPELVNPQAVARAVERNYPPLLRDAGIAGEAQVRMLVRADGGVENVRAVSATRRELGLAAERVASGMRLRPAVRGGSPVPVEVVVPFTFTPSATAVSSPPTGAVVRREERRLDASMQVIAAELKARHPDIYRDGTRGRQFVWFVADRQGRVRDTGLGEIPASEYPGWTSESLVADMRSRFPGIDVASVVLGRAERLPGDTGPEARVAWVVVDE